jgi:hypothetical protein
MHTGRAGYLTGSFSLAVKEIRSDSRFRNDATGMFLAALLAINDYYAILVPPGDSLVGAHKRA